MQTAEDVPIYRIKTVSALTGISVKRIRAWDGLVCAARMKGGHRLYLTRDVRLLQDIRRLMEEEGLTLRAVASRLEAKQSEN